MVHPSVHPSVRPSFLSVPKDKEDSIPHSPILRLLIFIIFFRFLFVGELPLPPLANSTHPHPHPVEVEKFLEVSAVRHMRTIKLSKTRPPLMHYVIDLAL